MPIAVRDIQITTHTPATANRIDHHGRTDIPADLSDPQTATSEGAK
jgi:hypothetical protein